MNNRVVCVMQHVLAEGLGHIEDCLRAEKLTVEVCKIFDGQSVPKGMEGFQALVVLGGPMSVNERENLPYLADEMKLMEQAMKERKPVLGICLGSQMLASVLGGGVKKAPGKEIGWHAVRLNDASVNDGLWAGVPRSFQAFHWHGEVFDLPVGAIPLASSEMTGVQAFRYGKNAYGILFHLEVTLGMIEGMLGQFPEELKEAGKTAEEVLGGAKTNLPGLHHIGATVLERWAALVRKVNS
jgi:GMP synthase (glutamine-hydrolysing)